MERKKILYAEIEPMNFKKYSQYLLEGFPENPIETFRNETSLQERLEQGGVNNIGVVITDNTKIIETFAKKLNFPFILMYEGFPEIGQKSFRGWCFNLFTPTCNNGLV